MYDNELLLASASLPPLLVATFKVVQVEVSKVLIIHNNKNNVHSAERVRSSCF